MNSGTQQLEKEKTFITETKNNLGQETGAPEARAYLHSLENLRDPENPRQDREAQASERWGLDATKGRDLLEQHNFISNQSDLFENSRLLKDMFQNPNEADAISMLRNPFDFYNQMVIKKKKKDFESQDRKIVFKEQGRLEMKSAKGNWNIELDFREKEDLKKIEAKNLYIRIKKNNFKIKKDFRSIKNSKQSYKDYVEMKSEYAIKKYKDIIKEMRNKKY